MRKILGKINNSAPLALFAWWFFSSMLLFAFHEVVVGSASIPLHSIILGLRVSDWFLLLAIPLGFLFYHWTSGLKATYPPDETTKQKLSEERLSHILEVEVDPALDEPLETVVKNQKSDDKN
jgi:hypothetical protein